MRFGVVRNFDLSMQSTRSLFVASTPIRPQLPPLIPHPLSSQTHFRQSPSIRQTSQVVIKAQQNGTLSTVSASHHQVPIKTQTKRIPKIILKSAIVLAAALCLRLLVPKLAFASEASSTGFSVGNMLRSFVDFFLHLDKHLSAIISKYGRATYALLFGIVFCETGLVLTPLLPGDSLLFAAGTMAGLGKLNIFYLFVIFIVAAILGDAVNYAIGSWLGQKAVESRFISKSAIQDTEAFYEKYGGKTIVLARFVPIVRTFAPFVAGVSHMAYRAFVAYNVGGAILWTVLFCGGGFFFGNLPFVEKNFSIVILAIVVVSILPTIYEIAAATSTHKRKN